MQNKGGFWQKPSNTAVLVIAVLALGMAMAALFKNTPVQTASAQGSPTTGQQQQVLLALQDGFVRIAESVEPSVVSIEATTRPTAAQRRQAPGANPPSDDSDGMFPFPNPFDFFRQNPQSPAPQPAPRFGQSSGSGVIVRVNGNTSYILTNNHVVDEATEIKVVMPGRDAQRITAKLVGRDQKTDLAVLSIPTPKGVTAASIPKLGDSSKVKVGQWSIAIGNPLGVGQTLTVGVISATGRELSGVEGVQNYGDMIQTDASINPGNSGGPLVNINGEVIGINTAIASPSRGSIGIGFAIPINLVKDILDQMITTGSVTRGYLGVSTTNANRRLSPELREFYGVEGGALVEEVSPGTPAAKAGVRPEDVIISWNNQTINDFDDLERLVQSTPPGRQVPLVVMRGGKRTNLTITTATRPPEDQIFGPGGRQDQTAPDEEAESRLGRFGMSVAPLTADVAKRLSIPESVKGVLVTNVDPGGPAYEAGIPRGSVIVRVGRTNTPTVSAFQNAIKTLKPGEAAVMLINVPGANNRRTTAVRTITPDETADE